MTLYDHHDLGIEKETGAYVPTEAQIRKAREALRAQRLSGQGPVEPFIGGRGRFRDAPIAEYSLRELDWEDDS